MTIYAEIAKDIETRFNALNYDLRRPLPIRLMKNELSRKIMKEFAVLRPRM